MSGVQVSFQLTKRQANALLNSEGLQGLYGVRRTLDLQEADMRLRHAVIRALDDIDELERPHH